MPEEIFDFLFDNPIFLILLIYWIASSVVSRKKKQKQLQEKNAPQQLVKPDRKERFREALNKLEQAVDQADRMLDGTPAVKPAQISPARPLASAQPTPLEKANDAYAFHSLTNQAGRKGPAISEMSNYDVTAKDYDLTAQDYDLTAQDYDVTAQDYDLTATDYDQAVEGKAAPKDAFAFHSLTQQEGAAYQTVGGFHEFHSAHGLSRQERTRVVAIQSVEVEGDSEHPELVIPISNPDELRRAFIFQEVLGPPKSLRK